VEKFLNTKDAIMADYALKPYIHNGQEVQIPFTSEAFFNATVAAKPFDKLPKDWLKTSDTQAYIEAVRRNVLTEQNQLVKIVQGGNSNEQGTWLHPKLGVAFARWLNPDFAVWADDQIQSILTGRQSFVMPRSFADALQLAADQARQLEAMQPKAEYYDRLMGTHGTVDLETAAKTLRTSRPKLIAFLQDRGILTRKCLPTQTYIDRDYMRVQLTTYEDVYGREQISQKTVITQPGLLYVRGLLDTLERSRALLKSEAA